MYANNGCVSQLMVPKTCSKRPQVDTLCGVLTQLCGKKSVYMYKTSKKSSRWGASKSDIMEIELSPANELFCHELCHICKFCGTHFVPDLEELCNQTTLNWLNERLLYTRAALVMTMRGNLWRWSLNMQEGF